MRAVPKCLACNFYLTGLPDTASAGVIAGMAAVTMTLRFRKTPELCGEHEHLFALLCHELSEAQSPKKSAKGAP